MEAPADEKFEVSSAALELEAEACCRSCVPGGHPSIATAVDRGGASRCSPSAQAALTFQRVPRRPLSEKRSKSTTIVVAEAAVPWRLLLLLLLAAVPLGQGRTTVCGAVRAASAAVSAASAAASAAAASALDALRLVSSAAVRGGSARTAASMRQRSGSDVNVDCEADPSPPPVLDATVSCSRGNGLRGACERAPAGGACSQLAATSSVAPRSSCSGSGEAVGSHVHCGTSATVEPYCASRRLRPANVTGSDSEN